MACLLDKKLTIVCPTRARPKPLRRLLDSIVRNTTDYSNFEIVFIHDDDDAATAQALLDYQKHFVQIEMRIHHRPRNFNLSSAYYNWSWKNGYLHGDYFWMAQDDVEILTKDWNILIIEAVEDFLKDKPDRVCCAFPLDIGNAASTPGNVWGWYPMVTKEAVEVIHYIYPAHCPVHGNEIWLREMYRAIGRYLPITNVQVDQISYRTHGESAPIDETGKSMLYRVKKYNYMATSFYDYSSSISKLKGAIHAGMGTKRQI